MKNFTTGASVNLGFHSFSEEEIIRFAKEYDPLDFHIDKTAAKKSIFGTLVASGPHLFHYFYKNKWLPVFKDTILAGLEINNWKLLAPVFPVKKYSGRAKIIFLKKNAEKKHAVVTWNFIFLDEQNNPVQKLEMTVLHKMD